MNFSSPILLVAAVKQQSGRELAALPVGKWRNREVSFVRFPGDEKYCRQSETEAIMQPKSYSPKLV